MSVGGVDTFDCPEGPVIECFNEPTWSPESINLEFGLYSGETKVAMEIMDTVEPNIGHLYLVVLAAIISFAVTEIVKPFIQVKCGGKSDSIVRIFSVLTGGIVALTIATRPEMIDFWMGASAGALNAFVVKVFKAKVKKTLGLDDTPKPQEEED